MREDEVDGGHTASALGRGIHTEPCYLRRVARATLTIVATIAGMNGNRYRCVADNGIGSPVPSNSAIVTLNVTINGCAFV